jgi:hypothetical protein
MRKLETACITLGMVLTAVPALAVDTHKVYSSSILVMIFLGFCALFLVSQLIPAIIMVFGTIKGLLKNAFKGKMVTQEQGKKDLH